MSKNEDRKTYRRIRNAIGYLSILLPVVLLILSLIPFFETEIQPSISKYYYTNLREILTGTLCAAALFLIAYKGFRENFFPLWRNDNLLSNIAGYSALGIAFIPTNPELNPQKIYTIIPVNADCIGKVHLAATLIFFLCMAIISLKVFTLGQETNKDIPISILNENRIYKLFGVTLLICAAVVLAILFTNEFSYIVFTVETVGLISIGILWLIKGRAFGDKGTIGLKIYGETNN